LRVGDGSSGRGLLPGNAAYCAMSLAP
jgi:hypothetical protein